MTLEAWAIDEHPSDAKIIRQTLGLLVNVAGGLAATGALAVTQKGTPSMTVLVAGGDLEEGGAVIPAYAASTGPYVFLNTATYEAVVEAAGASNNRIDTIIARVYDTNLDSSGKHEPVIEVLRGKEEAGVVKGGTKGVAVVPKAALVLAYVFVEAKTSKILTEDITNVASQVVGGIALANESVTDASVVKGRTLVETGNSYSAVNEEASSDFETSNGGPRPLEVMAWSTETVMKLYVGGSKFGEGGKKLIGTFAANAPVTFTVNPGEAWKAEYFAGYLKYVTRSL